MSKKFRGMDPYTGEPGPIVPPKTNLHEEIARLRAELAAAEKVVEAAWEVKNATTYHERAAAADALVREIDNWVKTCPTCGGSGSVINEHQFPDVSGDYRMCHACKGLGWRLNDE